ncbi:MAG: PIN domain-containing protein [Anaerolineales bacterium]|nr:PIN domain-containing protein [Anaerolineales bacterium]
MAIREEVTLVVSQVVLTETRRNLAQSTPEHAVLLDLIEEHIPLEIIYVTKHEVLSAAEHVVLKDAPIVAAARIGKVDLLVTLDQKHLLGKPEIAEYIKAKVVTPKEAIGQLHREE